MSTYYNYAERNAESYVNWGQIGKDVSKMLTDENDIREKKKKEIDDQSREFAKTLSEAPQGQYQDGNALINNFAADMQQTRLMDDRLLKSGQLKLKDYTLRRQNNLDGTQTLVDLQKVYQSTKKTMMDGLTSGNLQALVGWNMQQMEAYQNFSNSKAVIDPATGIVNLGKTKLNDQGLRVLTNEVIPVNVMRNLMTTPIETFKVNETLDSVKKGLGSRIQTMQELSSVTKTGSITKLTGIGALEQFSGTEEGKKYQGVVDNWNSAIDDQMASLLAANKYNLTSILTQNTGKYGMNSFTYDKKEAASDATKILMIQNPSSSLPEMDPNAPHYKEQYEEAKGWMKDQLLNKIDLEVSKTVTPQTQQLRSKTQVEADEQTDKDKTLAAAEAYANMYSGNPQQKTSGGTYASSSEKSNKVDIGKEGITTYDANGKVFHPFTVNGKDLSPDEFALSVANTSGIPVSQQPMFIKRFKEIAGSAPNKEFTGTFEKKEDQGAIPATPLVKFNRVLDSTLNDAFSIKETEGAPAEREYAIANKLNESLSNYGFSVVKSKSPVHLNEISIVNDKTGKETFINLRSGLSNSDISKKIKSFTNLNIDEALLKSADEAGLLGDSGILGKYGKKK